MNFVWVRIRSWHAIRFESRGGAARTLCGKWAEADAEVSEALPAGRSCESCLRIVARSADQPG